jgi:hypothetical protein
LWERYGHHETVLIDDFRGSRMKFTDLLDLLDRYEYMVEIKGGFRELISKNIVITSNKHPKDIYNLSDEDINQLIRQIDHIFNFDDPIELSHTQRLGNTIPTAY